MYGTVAAYEPGRSLTVAQPDRKTVTYTIEPHSALAASLARARARRLAVSRPENK